MTRVPFADIRALLSDLAPAPPPRIGDPALGRFGEIAAFMTTWRSQPGANRPVVALYAGSSGAEPKAVRAMLEAVAAGEAPVARLAQAAGAGLEAFDLAIDRPVADMTLGAAMSERECAATMAFGMEALAKQPDLLLPAILTDDDGASAAAVAMALYGGPAGEWAAEGSPAARAEAAVLRLRAEAGGDADPLDVLRQLGGRQMAAVAGAIIAARVQSVPVLLDGYAVCAAAAVLHRACPGALDHCRAAHLSAEPGHGALLERLGLRPILDLDLPGDGGLGALSALGLVRTAAAAVSA